MQQWYNVVVMLLILLFVSGCSDRSIPRREAVSGGSAQPLIFREELIASTNCAEIGDIVTFTVNLQKLSDKTTTIDGTPPFDITLTQMKIAKSEPTSLVRWSNTNQYPTNPTTVLAPGEQRIYTWQWQATQEFALTTLGDENVKVTFSMGALKIDNSTRTPAGETRVLIGVNKYYALNGLWKCSEMGQ